MIPLLTNVSSGFEKRIDGLKLDGRDIFPPRLGFSMSDGDAAVERQAVRKDDGWLRVASCGISIGGGCLARMRGRRQRRRKGLRAFQSVRDRDGCSVWQLRLALYVHGSGAR